MSNRNGSYPISVQPGIPNLPDTPKGWKKEPLGKYLEVIKRPVEMDDGDRYQLVTVKRSRGGVKEREELLGKEIKVKSQFYVKGSDFLISKRQIVHGACGLVPDKLDGAIVSGEYAVLGTNGCIDLDYLKYLSESIHFQQTCFHSSIGVHVEKMIFKLDRWLKWDFNIPPLPEQQKIARILSTWDHAIKNTEKLINISQQQKKALMQQLLTGKKRLPGFDGEWKQVRLSEIADILVSNVDKKTVSGEDSIQLCNYTDVYHNDFITNNIDFMTATAKVGQIKKYKIQYGDVLITKDSESPDDIAVPAFVDENFDNVLCGYHLAIIRPDSDQADGIFLSNLFSLPKIRYYFYTLANGATRFGLGLSSIKNATFHVPPLSEQQAIAKVLRNSCELIINQSKQLKTLKTQKKALMQQLLTGNRRVKLVQ